MTHDELLREIAKTYAVDLSDMGYTLDSAVVIRQAKALAAVVELHKPHKIPDWVPTKNEYICDGCVRMYPCPTIQAVEKELA